MPERDPADLLRFITREIWCERRYELIDELISDDFVDHIDAQGLDGTGRARYLPSVHVVHDVFSDDHEEAELIVADDHRAVSYARVTGTHDGELMGIPPTGRAVDYRSIGILRFVDGQVIERWGVGDSLTMMQQLGLFTSTRSPPDLEGPSGWHPGLRLVRVASPKSPGDRILMLALRIPRRSLRATTVAIVVVAVPLTLAGCSSDDDSSSAPTTLAPEQITVSDAHVTAGLTALKALFADAATAVASKAASASTFPDRLENEWKQIEGTVKKNEPTVYIDAEDALSAIDKAIDDGDGKAAATASTDFSAVVQTYLAKHP